MLGLVISASVFGVMVEDVVGRNGQTRQDTARLHWFVAHRPHWLVSAARWLTEGGSVPVLLVLSMGAALLLYRRHQPSLVAMTPAIALGIAAVLATAIKHVVARARPPLGVRLLPENEPSFPSGHATDSTALFVSLALVVAVVIFRRPLARAASVIAGFCIAGVIGLTRLVLGVHWPTDVVAGWALGTVVALVVSGACLALAADQAASTA